MWQPSVIISLPFCCVCVCPLDCDSIRDWLSKCQDDSETANYITANTKDVSFSIIMHLHELD